MEKKIAILGANSFIGKKLLKRLGNENCILLSSSKSKNTRIFKLGDDLNSIISDEEKIEALDNFPDSEVPVWGTFSPRITHPLP